MGENGGAPPAAGSSGRPPAPPGIPVPGSPRRRGPGPGAGGGAGPGPPHGSPARSLPGSRSQTPPDGAHMRNLSIGRSASFQHLGDGEPDPNNPMPHSIPPPTETGNLSEKHVIVMVGLPARGKTHMARRLARYLSFVHGADIQVFNVGQYRRNFIGKNMPPEFYDHDNARNSEARQACAEAAMKDMKTFLFQDRRQQALVDLAYDGSAVKGVDSGLIGIYDATNTTRKRRKWIAEQLKGLPIKLLFIESVCTDQQIIDRNIWVSKVRNEDFEATEREKAFMEFKQRIVFYERVYEPMDEEELSWVKMINCGQRLVMNRMKGFLPLRIVQFLANMHATEHSIYLTRHGQSEYNVLGKIGGDSPITEAGERYARELAKFAEERICTSEYGQPVKARLWTSSMVRTIQTAQHIKRPKLQFDGQSWTQMSHRIYRNLDELYAGICDGMTYKEIEEAFPDDFARRKADKLRYRYPRGESYLDIISRLDPLIMEMESYHEPLLVIGHQAVLRLIYAYFMGYTREESPTLSIPLNTVIKLTPKTYDCEESRITLGNLGNPEDGQAEPSDKAPDLWLRHSQRDPPSH